MRASTDVVSHIESEIAAGQLRPGDRLQSERELSETFGVARITIRDALRVLEARGLVDIRLGATGGAYVADAAISPVVESISTSIRLGRMSVAELAQARKLVESSTVELAAGQATADGIARLRANVEAGRGERRPEVQGQLARDFHVILAAITGNQVLAATVSAYIALLAAMFPNFEAHSQDISQRMHERLLALIERHDAAAARTLMLEHLSEFEERATRAAVRSKRP